MAHERPADADRNLLFGALALGAGLPYPRRVAEGCRAWAATAGRPLADLLVERGDLSAADRAALDFLVEAKLQEAGPQSSTGGARAGADTPGEQVRRVLAALDDAGEGLGPDAAGPSVA